MNRINNLSKEQILNDSLPLNDLLTNSLYYPACGFDGDVVKYFGKEIQSFIYCDYAIDEDDLLNQLETFQGYNIVGHRSIKKAELIPNGWAMKFPDSFDLKVYNKHQDVFRKPFAHWVVYERETKRGEEFGPYRFSLLYIGGEGVATYQALYWTHNKSAKILAIIQPGTGWGFNWTNFSSKDKELAWVVMNNQAGTPAKILYGGIGLDYEDLDWDGYKLTTIIEPYYNTSTPGRVTVWDKI